jgi:hypothetical protein
MKRILPLVVIVAAFGCAPPRQAATPAQRDAVVEKVVSRTRAVAVVADGEPRYVTNGAGQVLIGNPMRTVGTVTSQQEIAELTGALAETGAHGDTGVHFCGALPGQLFLDANGMPLVGALVHVDNNLVILFTNLAVLDGQIYYTQPTGEVFVGKSPLPSGDNPKYGALALKMVERFWPEELDRREIKRHNRVPGD